MHSARLTFLAFTVTLAGAGCSRTPTAASALPEAHGATATASTHRVVIELNVDSADDKWEGVLNNVEHLRTALGAERTRVEVVVHGKGLGLLLATNGAMKERLAKLAQGGVILAACENTMHRQNVKKEDLFSFATTVDSGVAEVVRKQEAGFAYLKGGG